MEERAKGHDIVTAATTAASLRFRAVMMTSFAFILGLVPLVIASGAGAATPARRRHRGVRRHDRSLDARHLRDPGPLRRLPDLPREGQGHRPEDATISCHPERKRGTFPVALKVPRYARDDIVSLSYSSLMFAACTTGRQRSISAAMCLPSASGGSSTGAPPSFCSRARTSAEATALLISSLRRAAMAGSMPAGPVMPYHWSASKPATPASAMVGSSGKGLRPPGAGDAQRGAGGSARPSASRPARR